jgi:hypothetical protein
MITLKLVMMGASTNKPIYFSWDAAYWRRKAKRRKVGLATDQTCAKPLGFAYQKLVR